MLKKVRRTSASTPAAGGHFAIVASTYNARYVDGMLGPAQRTLAAAGAKTVQIVRVPGAFEIPVVAMRLAQRRSPRLAAIVCLGVILRGATTHAQFIGEAVTQALMQIQLETGIPVIHEVLLLESPQQAEERCLDAEHNRGVEAAQTALAMGALRLR